MHCERCGLLFFPRQSVCTSCHTTPSRQWLQLMGLSALAIALVYNYLTAAYVLPRFLAGRPQPQWFKAWFWITANLALYGWILVAVALVCLCVYWERTIGKLEWQARVAQVLSILLLLSALARLFLPLIRASWAATARAAFESHADLARTLPWGVVALGIVTLCLNCETRDRLLGNGRGLSLAGLSLLVAVLATTLLAWRAL